jgi:4-aminobutyrate aminotransferase-like enzyme
VSFSDVPPPPEVDPGNDLPVVRVRPPGPESRSWLVRHAEFCAPMGPRVSGRPTATVYASGKGSNVIDADGNRYVDLAAGFGALLLGHAHPRVLGAIELEAPRLMQALGDVYPSEPKIALASRLAELFPEAGARVLFGQSGADAVSAALKTAVLHTGRPGVLAFHGAYHGLSYAPLAALGLRASYREPFVEQLNRHVTFVDTPRDEASADAALERARVALASGEIGAVLFEPILGRGGVVVPPPDFLGELARLARGAGALTVADEIWTGLGRAGKWLCSSELAPDLVCLGKGLGGGLPISACVGRGDAMRAWSREPEVVHTSTFAGAPLACVTALATLDVLSRGGLVSRSAELGQTWLAALRAALADVPGVVEVRGAGLMIGVDLGERPGAAAELMQLLLERGYIVSTGGEQRDVVVLTPPLVIVESLLHAFVPALVDALWELGS